MLQVRVPNSKHIRSVKVNLHSANKKPIPPHTGTLVSRADCVPSAATCKSGFHGHSRAFLQPYLYSLCFHLERRHPQGSGSVCATHLLLHREPSGVLLTSASAYIPHSQSGLATHLMTKSVSLLAMVITTSGTLYGVSRWLSMVALEITV